MSRASLLHRWIRWTTLLAVAVAALAPAASHALAAARGEVMPWSQVCSADAGLRAVAGTSSEPNAPGARHAFEHCPYCTLHHDGAAPPPAAAAWGLIAPPVQSVQALPLRAPRPLHARSPAQPRAPPTPI